MTQGPKFVDFPETHLVGVCLRMSHVEDRTSELWRTFRSASPSIAERVGREAFSVRIYNDQYSFSRFDPSAEFDKWAAAVVEADAGIPDGLKKLVIPAGRYAEFPHVGPAAAAPKTFGYIYGEWLPASGYDLDLRPHFEILPEDYDPFDNFANERILIPIC